MPSLLLRGGEVVTASDRFRADVLIDGERVAAVGDGREWEAERVFDVSGKMLLPGGIDAHTHLESPSGDFTTRTSDDFFSGTVAAAFGGTTTIIDFVKKEPALGVYDSYWRRVETASRKSIVDFAFHPVVPSSAAEDGSFDELRRLARDGATSWKFFMAYAGMMVEDPTLIRGFRACAEEGVLPMVHAENGHVVADSIRQLVAAGRTSAHWHHAAHPHVAEREATHRAIAIAESVGAPLFVVHVSSRFASEELERARDRGLLVWGETCPQYLLVGYEDYADLSFDAAAYICSPPIRERANQQYLWRALVRGSLSTIGTDHAPYMLGQPRDLPPQKQRGRGAFPLIPNGVPGIEDRLMVMYEAGVVGGHFDACRFVDLVSTSPAKLFGLYPRKGVIAPGSDADIVVWDPAADRVIRASEHHMHVDYNLYEGMHVSGEPVRVFSRGNLLVDGESLLAGPGRGQFLPRARFGDRSEVSSGPASTGRRA